MTTTQQTPASVRSALGWTLAIAAVWLIAAVARTETTLHLGPLILPILPAVLLRGHADAFKGVVVGFGVGAVVIAILSLSGNLDGPALEPFGSVLTESIVLLGGATVVGFVIAGIRR